MEDDLVSKMADVIKCQKCGQTCIDPRILECFDTFCLKCLEESCKLTPDVETSKRMSCPRCETVTVIPANGFRVNEFVKRLIRVLALSKPVEAGQFCDACWTEESKQVTATAFCLECQDNLCEECCKAHRKTKPSRNHQLLIFGRLSKSELEIKLDLDFCDRHKMNALEKYCETCKSVICNICLAESHKSHECSELKVTKDRLRRQIFAELEKLDVLSNRVLSVKEDLEKKKTDFMEDIQHTETAVRTRSQELKDLIDQHTEFLLGDIGMVQREGLDRLNRQKIDLDMHSAIVCSFRTYCSSLCSKGSSYDVCSPVSQIMDRVNELKSQNDAHIGRHLPLPTTQLKKTDLSDFYGLPNIIGDIKVTRPPEIVHTANLDFTGFSVMGVAKLRKSIYILCRTPHETVLTPLRPSSVIRVYNDDDKHFTLISEMKLDTLTSPFDMTSSEADDRLYVTDLNHVYKVTGGDREPERFLPWRWSPHTLSVSTGGRVLLCKDEKPCCVERYTQKAVLVDRIQLPTDVSSVKHAVEMSSGNFLVLLELETADLVQTTRSLTPTGLTKCPDWNPRGVRGIYELTNAGSIVRWFNPRIQSNQLDDPRHLALDSDGQVFVADHARDRLIQLDSELNFIQVIEKPGMFGPKRLFYHGGKQQLWIGHSKQLPIEEDVSGNINICDINPYIEQKNSSSLEELQSSC